MTGALPLHSLPQDFKLQCFEQLYRRSRQVHYAWQCQALYQDRYVPPDISISRTDGAGLGDSGKKVTYQYCTDCPTIVAVDIEAMPDTWIVKSGPCEDEELLRETNPGLEIYTKNRYPWVTPTGADEHESA